MELIPHASSTKNKEFLLSNTLIWVLGCFMTERFPLSWLSGLNISWCSFLLVPFLHMCAHQLLGWKDQHHLCFPPWEVEVSNEAASRLRVLQTGQPTRSQGLLTEYAFQPHYRLCCPPLAALKTLRNLCFGARNEEMHSIWGHNKTMMSNGRFLNR